MQALSPFTAVYIYSEFVNQGKSKERHFKAVLFLSLDPKGIVGKELSIWIGSYRKRTHTQNIQNVNLFFLSINSLKTHFTLSITLCNCLMHSVKRLFNLSHSDPWDI